MTFYLLKLYLEPEISFSKTTTDSMEIPACSNSPSIAQYTVLKDRMEGHDVEPLTRMEGKVLQGFKMF